MVNGRVDAGSVVPLAGARAPKHAKPRNPAAALAGRLDRAEVAAQTDFARGASAIARVQDRADAPPADPRDAPHARTASSAARRRRAAPTVEDRDITTTRVVK